jgi:5-methylcytosine-specific restriction endonuclease McrA
MQFRNWRQLTRDHIIPKGKGGDDSLDNLVVACKRCNDNKGQFDPRDPNNPNQKPTRDNLIERAKEKIVQKIEEERLAYEAMMKDVWCAE